MLTSNNMMLLLLLMGIVLLGSGVAEGFKDTQDGARILSRDDELNKISDSSYSIPFRKGSKVGGERASGSARFVEVKNGGEKGRRLDGGVPIGFDNAEFALLSQMKTMEIPPAADAVNYYAEKYASSPTTSRFAILSSRRVRRSPADLKFDNEKTGGSSSGTMGQQQTSGSNPSRSNIPSSSVSFDGQKGGNNNNPNPSGKEPTEENKRLFPELFGLGGAGYYPGGGHHYPGGHYPYPGGHHGHYPHYGGGGGYYPGAGGYYPGGGGYYPGGGFHGGYPGNGLGSSSAAASASSSAGGHGLHNRPVNGLYGGGYYPAGGVTPILGAGYGGGYPPYGGPGFFGGGFREGDKDGNKVSGSVAVSKGSGDGGKSTGGVSFE